MSNQGSDEELVLRLADEEQRRVASEKAFETAEFTAAQALLDKHIAVEEAQAHALAAGHRPWARRAVAETIAAGPPGYSEGINRCDHSHS